MQMDGLVHNVNIAQGSVKPSNIRFTKIIHFRGGKNRPISMVMCSFLVLGGPLYTGSRPSVVND